MKQSSDCRAPEMDVDYVAELAKLELSEEEKRMFSRDMREMAAFAGQLLQADVRDVPVTANAAPIKNVFHEDIPEPPLSRELLLANAPDQEGGYFFVPLAAEQ